MQNSVVIASACRTPIGDLLGALKDIHPRELGRIAGSDAVKRAGIAPGQVDELVCGKCYSGRGGGKYWAPGTGGAGHSLAGSGLHP